MPQMKIKLLPKIYSQFIEGILQKNAHISISISYKICPEAKISSD